MARIAHLEAPRQTLRRYPALAFLLAAAAMASLLPSALRLPLAGPASSAELAPVPGRGEGRGDLSALGASSTGGLGAGSGAGGSEGGFGFGPDTGDGGPGGAGGDPRDKRCVGKPARQTEDTLSPPCVAFFRGDNGGATSKGVTPTEIRVVVVVPCTTDAVVDHRDADAGDDDPVIKAYQDFFTERYQLFGRRLRLYSYRFTCNNPAPTPATLRARAVDIDERLQPFAAVSQQTPTPALAPLFQELARLQVVTFANVSRATADPVAPFVFGYPPDLDERADIEAAMVCEKLAPGPARFSGNALDRNKERVFGLVYDPETGGTGLSTEIVAFNRDLFTAALKRRCGLENLPEATTTKNSTADAGGGEQRSGALATLRDKGVTTVLSFAKYLEWSFAADAIKWYPEWVVPGTRGDADQARTQAPTVWANAIGLTYDRRRLETFRQPWYMAYQEECTGCAMPTSPANAAALYDELALAMRGIQAAGPRLTPYNLDRGLRAIEPNRSPDPFTPAAYFSPGGYGFIRDAALIWWDPSGKAPGTNDPGCYRLAEGGARYRADDWQPGDATIRSDAEQPCQGPLG